MHTTSVAVFLGIDDHLVGFEGDVLEHALHFLHSLLAFASGRTPAKLCNRPFAKRGRDGLALRIVPENALHTTSELIFAAVTHDDLAATSLEGCPCLPSRCPIQPSCVVAGRESIDLTGVTLAAIKALNSIVEVQKEQIDKLEEKIESLRKKNNSD